MNDHRCKRIMKETAHVRQKQIIIIFHSKLEPVEAAKTLCYTKVFTICPASFPKAANLSPLLLALEPSWDLSPSPLLHHAFYKFTMYYIM